jgi:hypothetical protein
VRPEDLVLDPWAPLSFRPLFKRATTRTSATGLSPTWVGDNARRLDAYRILSSYLLNVARLLQLGGTEAQQDAYREYGDPGLLVAQVRAALLADMRISVTGAEGTPPAEPRDPGTDASPEERAEFDKRLATWKADLADRDPALQLQDWFDEWAVKAKFRRKIVENEDTAVGLGDAVILAVWSAKAGRPVLRCYDPGFFFPVLDPLEDGDDEFPPKIHLAWEFDDFDPAVPNHDASAKVRFVRRITLELIDLAAPSVDPARAAATLLPLPWEQAGPEDTAGEGIRRSTQRCFMSDGVWRLDAIAGVTDPDRFPRSKARWLPDPDDPTGVAVLDHKPLGIDFIPAVHVPNTIPRGQFWGMSLLTTVAQLLDDIAATDSDRQTSSALTGSPPIWLKDAAGADSVMTSYGPGTVWKLSAEGQAGLIDTSKSLDALAGHLDALLKRLSTNARVPAEILGRVNASEVPSGVAMALAFGPFQSLIDDMRLIRSEKYALLLRFVARLAQLNGDLPAGPLPNVELTFGSYLPSDLTGVITLLLTALEAHGLSRATFLRLAAQAGLELGDLPDEEARIRSEDFAGAGLLADATGSDDLAAEYLGVEKPPAPPVQIVAAAAAAGGAPGAVPPPASAGAPPSDQPASPVRPPQ